MQQKKELLQGVIMYSADCCQCMCDIIYIYICMGAALFYVHALRSKAMHAWEQALAETCLAVGCRWAGHIISSRRMVKCVLYAGELRRESLRQGWSCLGCGNFFGIMKQHQPGL